MAKLKAMAKKEEIKTKKEQIEEEVNKENVEEEKDIINEDKILKIGVAKSSDLDYTLNLIASEFNIGNNYTVTKFDNGASKCKITLGSTDFEVTILVKDKIDKQYPSIVNKNQEENN